MEKEERINSLPYATTPIFEPQSQYLKKKARGIILDRPKSKAFLVKDRVRDVMVA